MDKYYYTYEYDQVIFETSTKHPEDEVWNVYGINLISRQINGEMFYCLYNGHADITRMVNEKGELAEKYYYDEWGVETETLKYGDITGDGKVNINDYSLMKRYALKGSADLCYEQIIVSDLDGDGKIDVNDSNILKQIIVKALKYCPSDTNQDGFINEKNNIKYAGYFYDGETGLYYLNARFYDPETARFIQEDSYRGGISDPLSLNLYTYSHNNPISYYDPTGHSIKSIFNAVKKATTAVKAATAVVKSIVVPQTKKVVKGSVKISIQSQFYVPTKEQKENWQSGINQLEESGTAGRNIASYSKGVINSLRSMSQSVEKTACDPFGTIRETKRSFQIDPSRFNPLYRAGNYLAGLYQAGKKGEWESFSYKLGQATPNIAVTAASAGIGQGVARSIAPGGINAGSGINSFATSNGALIGTGTLEGISVSAKDFALAGAVAGGTVATPGIAYSSSFNNNNCLNNASSGSSKTSQGNTGSGVDKSRSKPAQTIYNRYPNEPQAGKSYNYTIKDGKLKLENGIREVDFVVDMDGNLHVGKGHSYLANGGNVQAAGSMKVNNQGYVRLINNASGHYTPTVEQGEMFSQILNNAGLRTKNAWLELGEHSFTSSGYVDLSRIRKITKQIK